MYRKILFSLLTTVGLAVAPSPTGGTAWAQSGWAAFASGGNVYRCKVGGSPQKLYSGGVAHACWSAKGKYIYFVKSGGEIWRMNNDGSGAAKVTSGSSTNYNPIAPYRPDPEYVLYVSGSSFYKVNGNTGSKAKIHSGARSYVGEVAISSSGTKMAARDGKSDLYRINVGGGSSLYDTDCSASVSPDGGYLTSNVSGHEKLTIHKWSGGTLKVLDAPSGSKWDNQKFAVNSNDHVVYKYDNISAIGVVRVSDNKNTKIASMGSDYPDFFLGSLPAVSGCSTASDCDDNNPCTTDACSGGSCQHGAISGCCTKSSQCDDKNPCTKDACSANTCQHSAISGCCSADADCKDTNPCTADTCDKTTGNCSNKTISGCCAFDTDCADSDPCTLDKCDTGSHTCKHSPKSDCCTKDSHCDDKDPCTTDRCDTKSNSCEHDPIPGCGQPDKGMGTADAGATDGPPQSHDDHGVHDGGLDDDAGVQPADGPPAGLPEAGVSLDGGVTKNPARALEGGCSVSGSAPPFAAVVLLLAFLLLRTRRR